MPYVESAGARIYWEEHGAGEPLLMIMGLGYSLDMWHRTLPAMSARYRTLVFDNRGVGRSGVPPGPYTIAMMAADAAAVLDAAGVARARVLGMSMGGMVAQEFALAWPHRVEKLVLACTGCGGPQAVRPEAEAVNVLLNRAGMPREEAMEAPIPYIYDVGTPRASIEEDLAIRRGTFPTAAGYTAQLQAILGWQSYQRLGQIAAPTLVIHGENDRLVPPGNGRLIAKAIPGARLVPLPHASHIFTTDQPELAHAAILEFLL